MSSRTLFTSEAQQRAFRSLLNYDATLGVLTFIIFGGAFVSRYLTDTQRSNLGGLMMAAVLIYLPLLAISFFSSIRLSLKPTTPRCKRYAVTSSIVTGFTLLMSVVYLAAK